MKAQNNSRQVLVLSVVEVLDNEKDEEKKNKSENRGNAGIVVEMPTGEKWVADFHILNESSTTGWRGSAVQNIPL